MDEVTCTATHSYDLWKLDGTKTVDGTLYNRWESDYTPGDCLTGATFDKPATITACSSSDYDYWLNI